MAMFKCKNCGATFVEDRSYAGMCVRCPECHSQSEEIATVSNDFVCRECGLSCSGEDVKCPACGGDVIPKSAAILAELETQQQYEVQEQEEDSKAKPFWKKKSFWENFIWGLFLPNSGIWIAIWILSSFGVVKKNKRNVDGESLSGAICTIVLLIILGVALMKLQ